MKKTIAFTARVVGSAVLSFGAGLVLAIALGVLAPYLPDFMFAGNGTHAAWALWGVILVLNARMLDYSARWMP